MYSLNSNNFSSFLSRFLS